MNGKRYALGFIAVVAALALVAAGCGGGDSTSGGGYGGGSSGGKSTSSNQEASSESSGRYGGGGGKPSGSGPSRAAVISVGKAGDLGVVLVGSDGITVYDFHKDKGTTSSCYGACAEAWPPVLSEGEPEAENGASASKLGTTRRKDGTTQVTYAGHPLYTFTGDTKPGEAKGNDVNAFGAQWYALQANGQEPED